MAEISGPVQTSSSRKKLRSKRQNTRIRRMLMLIVMVMVMVSRKRFSLDSIGVLTSKPIRLLPLVYPGPQAGPAMSRSMA